MKASKALMSALREKGLIPADAKPYTRHNHLEAELLTAVLHDPEVQQYSLTFDLECIDKAADYEGLLWQFLQAFPGDHGVESVSCRTPDKDDSAPEYEVSCEVVRRGKKVRGRWRQTSDYVTPEFMALAAKLTKTKEWHPVPVETGDQTYAQLYLEAALARKLAKFRKDSTIGRDAFLTRKDPSSRLAHIEILPETLYDEVLAGLTERWLEPGGTWGDLGSWRSGAALELCLTGREEFIDCREGVSAVYPEIDLCLGQTQYAYQELLLPDEPCWYLGLADPSLRVIFEHQARKMGRYVLGEMTSSEEPDTEPHLLAAKDLSWVCCLEKRRKSPELAGGGMGMQRLIVAGDRLTEAVPSQCVRLSDDHAYPVYAEVMGRLETELTTRGYQRDSVTSFEQDTDTVKRWVRVRRVQEAVGDPIALKVTHILFLAELTKRFLDGDMFGIQLIREASTHDQPKEDTADNSWLITPESDAQRIADEMLAYIRGGLDWLESERSAAELVELLRQQGKYFNAAVVANSSPGAGDVEAILAQGLAERTNKWQREAFAEEAEKVLGIKLEV